MISAGSGAGTRRSRGARAASRRESSASALRVSDATRARLSQPEAVLRAPVRERRQLRLAHVRPRGCARLHAVLRAELGEGLAVDALVRRHVDGLAARALQVARLVQVLLGLQQQRLLDRHAVLEVEVRAVLLAPDGARERLLRGVLAGGELALEQQPLCLVGGHEVAGGVEQSLGEPPPVERLAAEQVAVPGLVDGLLRRDPARDDVEQHRVPRLAGVQRVEECRDALLGFERRGARAGRRRSRRGRGGPRRGSGWSGRRCGGERLARCERFFVPPRAGVTPPSVAALVLLAGAAGARLVAAHLGHHARRGRRRGAAVLRARPAHARAGGDRGARPRDLDRPGVEELAGDGGADVLEQLLPHVVGLALVGDQRVSPARTHGGQCPAAARRRR